MLTFILVRIAVVVAIFVGPSAASAVTVAPDGTSSYLFAWHGPGDTIDLILPGGGDSWSLLLSDPSEVTISVRDKLWPNASFSLTGTGGAALDWTYTSDTGPFHGVYEADLDPGAYEFSLTVDPLSVWAGLGSAQFTVSAQMPSPVPLPPALPVFAGLLLGGGALLRRRGASARR
ncbi:hypothetical protein [Salipiger sp. PrR002]|uniref:hypothetical protein n=1 Tax=Salipiger sp. PrR002 TaxID=2706489 RepID=UPI0013BA1982|nr:hypothetical protein [Salipiger sp. PrR002]NDV98525.1 hypothetical protein [Salipiger sp. PrR002]NDW57360.1 hypothetical protein [Salipiger sp. PrR004]